MSESQLVGVTDYADAEPLPVRHLSVLKAGESHHVAQRVVPLRAFGGHFHRLAVLACIETAIVIAAVYLAALVRFPGESLASIEALLGPLGPRAVLAASLVLMGLASVGLYHLRQRINFAGLLARLAVTVGGAGAALVLFFYVFPQLSLGRGIMAIALGISFLGLAAVRFGFARLVDWDVFKRRVLVLGAGPLAGEIALSLRRRSDQRGFRVVAYVGMPGDTLAVPAAQVVHPEGELLDYILRARVQEVIVAMDDRRRAFPAAMLRQCRLHGIFVRDVVSFLESENGYVSVDLAPPSWLIFSEGFRSDVLRAATKRLLDVAAAVVLLVATAPVALLAALAVWLEDRGPIFYRQVRTGQNGQPFKIIKFRSMSVAAEAHGAVWAVKNDPRVTRVGAFIRKTRIDELPQAMNVLLGHMSFVGPRPERPEFVQSLARKIPHYPERHFVKPGITGWAQVRFPYGASEEDSKKKLGYDLYYVKNHGVVFDLIVLLRTVEIVLFRVGSR